MKIPVIVTKDYIIYLEYFNKMYWLHTDVFKWTKSIKEQYLENLNRLQKWINADLFGLVDTQKLGKFGNKIGFTFLENVTGLDNNQYKVFIRRLEWVE
jgi:hypothetical protein